MPANNFFPMTKFKRTKLVCTIGPSSRSPQVLRAMIRAGMNVARLNFSHGTYEDHARLMKNIRLAARACGEPVAILQDLQGPKIRLGDLPESGVKLAEGKTVVFNTALSKYIDASPPVLPVTYGGMHKDVAAGDRILINDGLVEARVTRVRGRDIFAIVVVGGVVTSHKGMNFPDSTLSVSAITEKDRRDAAFGVKNGVDWIALSFVISPKEIATLRRLISASAKRGQTLPRILAKIEKHEAIDRFAEILDAVDGILLGRGDLGIEIPAEEVPLRQKEIVEACRLAGKPVIVATQMLESMMLNPRATRAEVSDVANAVMDHTDAIMLSGESATGKYPVEAVATMSRIALKTEASPFDDLPVEDDTFAFTDSVLSHTLHVLAAKDAIDGVVAATFLAPWSERLNVARPEVPLFLASDDETEVRQLNLRWAVRPFLMRAAAAESFGSRAIAELKKQHLVRRGMRLAVVQGGARGIGFDLMLVK